MTSVPPKLLLGEWACLGVLYQGKAHGFAISARLRESGDIGRVWTLSRPLTYRALDQLVERGYVRAVGEERGIAGGNRTILAATRHGRASLRAWMTAPVRTLRDVRSELLLKLVLAAGCGLETGPLLDAQRDLIEAIVASRQQGEPGDVVAIWREESAAAALRFLERIRQ